MGSTWMSFCRSAADIFNPAQGATIGMQFRGAFDDATDPVGHTGELLERKGLSRTSANNGAIFCTNADNLIGFEGGTVALWLNLPEAIVNGIYAPLNNDVNLKDCVLWGVNFGDTYITPPGFYAALTPAGIEFTIWTGAGKQTVLDTTSNIAANTDCLMEFAWTSEPPHLRAEANMALIVNGEVTAEANLTMDGRQSLVGLNLWVLDTPSGSSGLNGTVQRVEIYDQTPLRFL